MSIHQNDNDGKYIYDVDAPPGGRADLFNLLRPSDRAALAAVAFGTPVAIPHNYTTIEHEDASFKNPR